MWYLYKVVCMFAPTHRQALVKQRWHMRKYNKPSSAMLPYTFLLLMRSRFFVFIHSGFIGFVFKASFVKFVKWIYLPTTIQQQSQLIFNRITCSAPAPSHTFARRFSNHRLLTCISVFWVALMWMCAIITRCACEFNPPR